MIRKSWIHSIFVIDPFGPDYRLNIIGTIRIFMDVVWLLIIVAGLLEPCWVYTMEKSENIRNIPWAAATLIILAVYLLLLSQAMEVLGPGTSYAIWTGIGAICTLIMGIALFDDSASWVRIVFVMLIVAGIVGLNLTSGGA